jgi:uncharacterized membrane protein
MIRTFSFSKHRMDAYVDGVFAIASTLLVLDLRIPEALASTDVPGHLYALTPRLITYALSFALLGAYWLVHWFETNFLVRYDFGTIVAQLFSLMMIAIIPFTTATLGAYPNSGWAEAMWAGEEY